MASNDDNKQEDVVAIELPAPAGWIKKFTPKKGGTPRRKDIVFVSPTGEVIKNKRHLEQYLKSHTGGPAASEFDWGSGDSPRRSVRLSEKLKVSEIPENESPKKKQRTPSLNKVAKEKHGADGEDEATVDKDATVEEIKEIAEVSMACAEDAGDEEVITEGALPKKPNVDKDATAEETKEIAEVYMACAEDAGGEEVITEGALPKKPNVDKDATLEENKEIAEVSMACAEDAGGEEVITEGALPKKPDVETMEKKTKGEEMLGEPVAVEIPNNAATEGVDAKVEESKDATTEMVDLKIEESKDATAELADAKPDESKATSCSVAKETPVEKVDGEEKVCVNQDNGQGKQAVEKPDKNGTEPVESN